MTTRDPVFAGIQEALATAAGIKNVSTITRDTRLYHDLPILSLSLLEIVAQVEARFCIDLSVNDMAELCGRDGVTVGDLTDVVGDVIARAAASLDDAVARAEEAFA